MARSPHLAIGLLTLTLVLAGSVGSDHLLDVAELERGVPVQVAGAQVGRVRQPAGALEERQLARADVVAVALFRGDPAEVGGPRLVWLPAAGRAL